MKYFLKVAKFFKNTLKQKISVRRINLQTNIDGLCEKKDNKFLIRINKNLPENHAVDVLLHEIAHAVSWEKDKDIHGTNWGKTYSKIYRMFLKEFLT